MKSGICLKMAGFPKIVIETTGLKEIKPRFVNERTMISALKAPAKANFLLRVNATLVELLFICISL